jgi:hypothetical protein
MEALLLIYIKVYDFAFSDGYDDPWAIVAAC